MPGERRPFVQMDCLMSRLRILPEPDHMPALHRAMFRPPLAAGLGALEPKPRILLLYGSPSERSFRRFAVAEAARLQFGWETCRDSVCQHVLSSGVTLHFKNKQTRLVSS